MLLNKLDLGDQTSYLKNHEMRRTVKQPQHTETYVAPLPLKYWNYLCFSKFFWKTQVIFLTILHYIISCVTCMYLSSSIFYYSYCVKLNQKQYCINTVNRIYIIYSKLYYYVILIYPDEITINNGLLNLMIYTNK